MGEPLLPCTARMTPWASARAVKARHASAAKAKECMLECGIDPAIHCKSKRSEWPLPTMYKMERKVGRPARKERKNKRESQRIC
jgi:hypothetical protein